MAVESIMPYADFAQTLFDTPNALEDSQTTRLIRVGDNKEGQPVYVYVEKDSGAPDTRDFSFVTCIAAEISEEEFAELGDEDQRQLQFLGRSLEGKTLFGVIVVREPLSDVTYGYDDLTTVEAVEIRKEGSIAQVGKIEQTVGYIKKGILASDIHRWA